MTALDDIPYVQAKNYTPGRTVPVTMIVIHDMEAGENTNTAENCAAFFAGASAPQASAHYNCDSDSVVCSVRPDDTAWHTAERRTNSCGIGIEQAGYAAQTKADWADDYSRSMIFGQVAPLVRALADRYGIPLVVLTADDLKAGRMSGVTTHASISEAFVPGGHTDPGPNYPLVEMVAAAAGTSTPTPGVSYMAMISTVTLPASHPTLAGCVVEARALLGGVVHRWQTRPGAGQSKYVTLKKPPAPVDSVDLAVDADGRLEVLAWLTSDAGKVYRLWQVKPGGDWSDWLEA